jgi:predicted ribosome quality control (RQC) complex YloA/Tae2 family protein
VLRLAKKDFSSFDLRAVVGELQGRLVDARVNNVYQLDAKTLLFKLHKVNEAPLQLVLEAGRRLHLTGYSLEKPSAPPPFCMTLRKYLPGSWLVGVEQYEFERIAIFHFKVKEESYRLVLELFGEGNIILLNGKGEILQALIFKRMRDRNIVRNEVYQFPPSFGKNPFKLTKDEFESGLKAAGDVEVVRFIVRFLGLGGVYAEELLLRARVEKTKLCSALVSLDLDLLFEALQSLLRGVTAGKLEPSIVLDSNEGFVDVIPFKLQRYETFKSKTYSSFSETLDEFFVRVTAAEKAAASINVGQFKSEADRLKRMIGEQEHVLAEEEHKMDRDKKVGDAIYSRFGDLQALLEKFSSARLLGKNLGEVTGEVLAVKKAGGLIESYFEGFDSRNLAINVRVNDLPISLSLRMSLYENAAEFYDRGKQAKQKSVLVVSALEDSKKKFADIEKRLSEVEALRSAAPAEALEELENRRVETKEWFEKFRWFRSSEDFLVVAGKDAVSNEVLIKKYTEQYDFVFHVEIVGSPFVVVKTGGKEPGEATLREAAEFAADFSRAWRESMGAVDVYWVKPEQLSKSGPSGESVAHGAFVVNGKRNWLRGTALKMAIGFVEGDEGSFIGGPLDAVKAKTKYYLVLCPGDVAGKDLLKQVLRSLTLKLPKEMREKMGKTSVEAVREFVPYTKGRILDKI